ncbi:hypothetical protein [Streptomyces sp. NPDC058667]|uniref:hypothetical protein n=1 Tax=Streptomyces sp. NPDC058667 TaxID=3346588 RepID=UPI003667478E
MRPTGARESAVDRESGAVPDVVAHGVVACGGHDMEDIGLLELGPPASVIPPKDVWSRWYIKIKAARRPVGTLAIPTIATTATLHFTHVFQDGDSLMALGLTALAVVYDAVITICRTWHKTAFTESNAARQDSPRYRTAA